MSQGGDGDSLMGLFSTRGSSTREVSNEGAGKTGPSKVITSSSSSTPGEKSSNTKSSAASTQKSSSNTQSTAA